MKTQAIIPGLLTRVVGIDCHPDISVLQVTEGTNAFDFYTVGGACRMENGRLREWLKSHAQKNDVFSVATLWDISVLKPEKACSRRVKA